MRRLLIEALALWPISLLALLPYAAIVAAEDGLPGDPERIIATAVAASIGIFIFGAIVLAIIRDKPRRLAWAVGVVLIACALATLAALRRTHGA